MYIFAHVHSQLTSSLITTLLNRYAGDVGMSESLTTRLLEDTPTLFSHDDAVASKAKELVSMAMSSKSKYKQLGFLRESVKVSVIMTTSMPEYTDLAIYSIMSK